MPEDLRLPDSCALSFAALPIVDNGQVEVYDAAQRCFFSGYLKDIDKSRVLVQFDSTDSKQSGPVKWFDWSVVREVPPVVKHPPLAEGHLVEVSYTDEGSNEKPAWWEAKIVQKKGVRNRFQPCAESANRGLRRHFRLIVVHPQHPQVPSTRCTSSAVPSLTRPLKRRRSDRRLRVSQRG